MKILPRSLFILLSILMGASLCASDTVYYEIWDISKLDSIGGHAVTVMGDPRVVSTEMGDAIRFDGDEDRLLVDFNPIMDAREFTVELVFKPDACYPQNAEPRFVHIQDPDDPDEKRVMIELRVDAHNQCYMDGFMKTDSDKLALIDESLVHPTEVWQHVAITFRENTFTTYFNGMEELSGTLGYNSAIINTTGKTSLGGRMDHRAFYAGLMKTLKVSHACLDPEEFILPESGNTSNTETESLAQGLEWEVYPNPADGILRMRRGKDWVTGDAEVRIYNISGNLMHLQADVKDGEDICVDASDFPEGVYLLRLSSGGRSLQKRIVIVH